MSAGKGRSRRESLRRGGLGSRVVLKDTHTQKKKKKKKKKKEREKKERGPVGGFVVEFRGAHCFDRNSNDVAYPALPASAVASPPAPPSATSGCGRRRTWSIATSMPRSPTGSGSPTSPTCRLGPASSTWPFCWSRLAPHRRLGDGHDLKAQLVLDALNMALAQATCRGHPSFRPGIAIYLDCLRSETKEAGVRPSMGLVGDAYDNAMCESFFATLECEAARPAQVPHQGGGPHGHLPVHRRLVYSGRRHSALGYKSPINYERSTRDQLESVSP